MQKLDIGMRGSATLIRRISYIFYAVPYSPLNWFCLAVQPKPNTALNVSRNIPRLVLELYHIHVFFGVYATILYTRNA